MAVLAGLLTIATEVAAQQTIKRSPQSEEKADSLELSYISFGSEYVSKVVFWGRDFGEPQYGLSPYLLYTSAKGLYAYAYSDYWSANEHKPARNTLGIGYGWEVTKKVYLFVGYERWINHYGDDYLDESLQNAIEFDVDYELGGFAVRHAFYFMFGLERVYQVDLTIERKIPLCSFFRKGEISLLPELTTSLATPVFDYIYVEEPDPEYDYEKLRLVDLDGSVSLQIELGGFELVGSAHYNVPVKTGNGAMMPFPYFGVDLNYNLEF